MARIFNQTTLEILKQIALHPKISAPKLFENFSSTLNYKEFYNTLYRLEQLSFVEKFDIGGKLCMTITEPGQQMLRRFHPERDGVWKLVIFDIPEKQKYVRTVLRAKLKSLHFKKWQNSIWISPFALDEEIEQELNELSKKFFVRLIKTTDINNVSDLEKLF